MEDNIIIENMEFTEEMYKKVIAESIFDDEGVHGIGDEADGNN